MRFVVTGAAGFIGSKLCEALKSQGRDVLAVDSFTPYYDVAIKRAHWISLKAMGIAVEERDVAEQGIDSLLRSGDVIIHLAGQPGVRLSWEGGFPEYLKQNVSATQRVLEAAKTCEVRKVVFASSSSIYGNDVPHPTPEDALPRPFSPYGVTKLAAEMLSEAYVQNGGVPVTALRYFTVYGPRQRPDMAMHRFIEAVLDGRAVSVFGDGLQRRDFTFVDDIVDATIRAADSRDEGFTAVNVAGGSSMTVLELLSLLEDATGRSARTEWLPMQAGDVRDTGGDISRAKSLWGWVPNVDPKTGVAAQVDWHLSRRR